MKHCLAKNTLKPCNFPHCMCPLPEGTAYADPVKPVPLPERREEVYQILWRCGCLPTIARDITDRIFRVIIGEQPNFRERMETFFRRNTMDNKQEDAGRQSLRGDKWTVEELAAMAEKATGQARQQLKGGIHPSADTVQRILVDFYTSPAYDPKATRNADTVAAAIGFTLSVRANVPPAAPVVPARQETFLDRLHKEFGCTRNSVAQGIRLHKEYSELNEKKVKLWAFIASLGFLDLPAVEQDRLRKQHTVMDQYSQILIERISYAEHIQKSRDDQSSASADPDGDNVSWPGEGLDEDMRVTGGGKSEDPLPFKD